MIMASRAAQTQQFRLRAPYKPASEVLKRMFVVQNSCRKWAKRPWKPVQADCGGGSALIDDDRRVGLCAQFLGPSLELRILGKAAGGHRVLGADTSQFARAHGVIG
jgi:hypothetical protein